MQKKDCYYLGTITRTHGLNGDVLIKIDTDQPELYYKLESVFVDINSQLVPFSLESISAYKSDVLMAKFKDADVDQIKGKDIYLPLSTLPKLEGNAFYYHEVIGFNIYDGDNKIGPILEINDNASQDYFVVSKADTAQLIIPIIKDWITEVNREEQYITMNLPEGILEL